MSTELNKKNFRSIPEMIWNTRDLSKTDEYFAADYVDHAQLPPGWPTGIEAFKQYTTELLNAFPDIQATVEEIMGEGDRVAGRVRMRGTNLGSFLGIPASGKVIEWTECHFGRMVDGKLVEHWGDQDRLGMMQQMGVIPAPEEQPAPQSTSQSAA